MADVDRARFCVDRGGDRARCEQVELPRCLTLARDRRAGWECHRLERAGESREGDAIESGEIRNESEQRLEFGLVLLVHDRRKVSVCDPGGNRTLAHGFEVHCSIH